MIFLFCKYRSNTIKGIFSFSKEIIKIKQLGGFNPFQGVTLGS